MIAATFPDLIKYISSAGSPLINICSFLWTIQELFEKINFLVLLKEGQ